MAFNWFLLSRTQSNDASYHQKHLDRNRAIFSRHLCPFFFLEEQIPLFYRCLLVFWETSPSFLAMHFDRFSFVEEGKRSRLLDNAGKEFYIPMKVLLDLKSTSLNSSLFLSKCPFAWICIYVARSSAVYLYYDNYVSLVSRVEWGHLSLVVERHVYICFFLKIRREIYGQK